MDRLTFKVGRVVAELSHWKHSFLDLHLQQARARAVPVEVSTCLVFSAALSAGLSTATVQWPYLFLVPTGFR